jgi:sulfur carrier protein
MTLLLNGTPHQLAAPVTLAALLESLGLQGKPVVVELNEVAVFPRDFPLTWVPEAARIEIVTLAAGG